MVIASRTSVPLSLSLSPSTRYPPFDRIQTRSLQTAHHRRAAPRRYTACVRREWILASVTIDFKPDLIGFSRGAG